MSSRGQDPSRQPARPSESPRKSEGHSAAGSYGGAATRGPDESSGQISSESIATFPDSDRYRQLSEPISGGMGVVFKALHVELDIEVAVKRILPKFAAQTELIKRFEREARVQVRLKHAHLVPVRDYAKDESGPYIVMDWIDGDNLAAVVKKSGPMEWQRAALLISKVASALQVAHHAKIIHRDIKPGNILLDQNGEPYVTDFGLARIEARVEGASETAADAILGTINFAAPEQQRNPQDAVFQSDIWSLGATLYQLLTGHDVLGMRESLIPEPLRDIVLKATERAIADRYQDMGDFATALKIALGVVRSPAVNSKPSGKTEGSDNTLADQWKRMKKQVQQTQAEAKKIIQNHQDYAAAAKMLENVPEHLLDTKLFNKVIRRRDRVNDLNEQIRTAVSQMRSDGLRPAIQELLKLQPKRNDLQELLTQLPQEPLQPPPLSSAPIENQQPKFAEILSNDWRYQSGRLLGTSERLNRLQYFHRALSMVLVCISVLLIIELVISFDDKYRMGPLWLYQALTFSTLIFVTYFHFIVAAKRAHDFGCSGWVNLLLLVPFLNILWLILLLLLPGDAHSNQFGRRPR